MPGLLIIIGYRFGKIGTRGLHLEFGMSRMGDGVIWKLAVGKELGS